MLISNKLPAIKRPLQSFLPDFVAIDVTGIDFAFLSARGIKACFIDLDGTTVPRDSHRVCMEIQHALKDAGMPIYIATNRPVTRDLKNLQQDLSAVGIIQPKGAFSKPSKRYFRTGLARYGLKPHEVVMVGDRFWQDIFGANRAGIYSLVVSKNGEALGRLDRTVSRFEYVYLAWLKRRYFDKI